MFGSQSNSATVGGSTFRASAVTASESELLTPAGREAVRSRCPYARLGVAFYRARFIHWTMQRGAQVPTWRRPRNCADARWLATVWAERSRLSRRKTELWRERRFDHVVRKLERAMSGTPMSGTGRDLEEIGRRYHVSPYFIVAVAATESSIGIAACSSNRKNVWGLSSCGSGWYVPQFASWAEAYAFFARFVNRQWPGHSTPYSFRGYAACADCWARKVSSWMNHLFGVPAVTRYP